MNQATFRTLWDGVFPAYRNETAVVCGDHRQTYGELLERSQKLGSALYKSGVRTQDRVSMLAMNCHQYIEFYTACELSGFIAATINFRLAAPEVEYIVGDASPKVLIFESQYTEMLESIRHTFTSVERYVCIGDEAEVPEWAISYDSFIATGDAGGAPSSPRPSDTAYLIYTSGTTGKPKGCMLGHKGQVASCGFISHWLQMSPSSSTLLVMPFFHIGAKALQQGQHRAGGTVHIHREFDPVAIFEAVQNERITNLHLAPVMIQMLVEHPDVSRYDLSSVRSICYSAAPMTEPVLRKGLKLLGPVFVQFWGQTESSGTVLPAAFHRPDGDEKDRRRLMSIGHAFPETEIRIVDEEDRELPRGTPGEMVLRGPAVLQGYWNNSAATVETLRNGWHHTGDVCEMDEDGFLYLVDRKKDVIISGGENIYSREVEEALLKLDEIAECAVVGVPHERWGEAVCAVVVKRPGSGLAGEDLVAHCRTLIAGYKRPRYVVFTDELPKLPSGKIDKKEIRRNVAATDLQEIKT